MPAPSNDVHYEHCELCQGKGLIMVIVMKECPTCEGTGSVFGNVCPRCHGLLPELAVEEERPCPACMGGTVI